MTTLIKEWYMTTYPTDEVGATLNDKATFNDLFNALDTYQNVYNVLGGDADSIVRERAFQKLSELLGTDYDYVYEQWLKS
jgi:hypothetical protein